MAHSVSSRGNDPAAFAIDADQRIVMWSQAAERLLHIEASQALGFSCYQVFAAEDPFGRPLCRPDCSLCQDIKNGKLARRYHLIVQNQKGGKLHLACDAVPLPPGPGPRAIMILRNARHKESSDLDLLMTTGAGPRRGAKGWLSPLLQYLGTLGVISATPLSPDLTQALDKVSANILRVTGAEAAEIFLKAEQGKEMVLTAHRGLFPRAFSQFTRFALGEGFPGLVAASAQPLVTSDLAHDSRYLRSWVKEKGFQFYLCVPLTAEQGTVGCINIASRRQEENIPSKLQFLSWLAPSLATSIQMAWLQSQDLLSNYQVEPLLDATQNMNRLLSHILEITMAVAQAEAGAIGLYQASTRTLDTGAVSGAFGETLCEAFSVGGASGCPLVKENRAIISSASRHTWPPACRLLSKKAAVVCLPLRVDAGLIGAIVLSQEKPDRMWTTKHLSILSAISERAALALKNAQAYLRPREMMVAGEAPYAVSAERKGEFSTARSEPLLDIHCFGRFQLYLDGKFLSPRVFRRRKSLAALKILLTHREQFLTREQLTEYLWPEASPEAAAKSLTVLIHDLRQGLANSSSSQCSFIVVDDGSYMFNTQATYRLDVDEFLNGVKHGGELQARGKRDEALKVYQLAAQLYRGDYLQDELYSDWCTAERERLQMVYLTLLEKIASLLAEEGDLEGSARYLQQLLAVDSLKEAVHRQLMYCFWKAGRSDEALRQYEKCQQVLAEELGVKPLKETEELYHRILKERGKVIKSKI